MEDGFGEVSSWVAIIKAMKVRAMKAKAMKALSVDDKACRKLKHAIKLRLSIKR
jgi:hypothetical protein